MRDFISETHDAYTFVLDLLFNMCPLKNKYHVYAIFSDEFMSKAILDSIGIYDTFTFFDHFHLKMNLEKSLLSKCKILKLYIDLMFTASDEIVSISLYGQAINICKERNSSVMILIRLMEKKVYWAPYLIDQVKGTFGL